MDVPAAAATASPPAPPTLAASVLPPAPDPGSQPVAAGSANAAPPAPAPAAPVAATGRAETPSANAGQTDDSIKPVVAKLFNAQSENVVVSFQINRKLNEVITVFTDKSTGKEIVQFPSQQLVALAEFFNKLAGNVLDKSA